jgi:hypothetical protein
MRHPVIISSLEEDFKNLGLVDKDDTITHDDDDELQEKRRRVSGSGRSKKTVKMRGKKLAKSRSYERKMKSKRKRSAKKRAKSGAGKKLSRFNKRFEGQEDSMKATLHLGKLAGLFEEVEGILSSLDEDRVENAVKSFANIAIISEMLGDFFSTVLEEDIEDEELVEELSEAAEFFTDLSESAADIATHLNEGEELEVGLDEIEEAFNEQMEALVDGLEFYADLTEDEESDDEDDDLDEDEDEYEDDDELAEMDDEDDDDGGKKIPDFIKKKMKAKMGKG